ncbi:hypothetical protein FRC02_010882 [Tulasnella sp. 418]|nr:hypothetical protein FRC02_010882 [Tulasnella sp. 418]
MVSDLITASPRHHESIYTRATILRNIRLAILAYTIGHQNCAKLGLIGTIELFLTALFPCNHKKVHLKKVPVLTTIMLSNKVRNITADVSFRHYFQILQVS